MSDCPKLVCEGCPPSPFGSDGLTPDPPPCEDIVFNTVTPYIFSSEIQWFSGDSSDFPEGLYEVRYVEGAMKYNGSFGWSVNYSVTAGFLVKYNDGANEVSAVVITGDFVNQAAAEAANAGQKVQFTHTGGKIGIYLKDSPYNDNVEGDPNPTFTLVKVCAE